MHHKELGDYGETIAQNWLLGKNHHILEKNYQCYQGELDIVSIDPQGVLCFIEVKTSRTSYNAALSVSKKKQQQLYRVAQNFLIRRKHTHNHMRFDVISIQLFKSNSQLNYYQNAFIPSLN